MRRRDVFTRRKRREVMSSIRARGSKLDRAMQGMLERAGFDYEMYPTLYGNPDFLVKPNVAVFCDSAFWHGRKWAKLRRKLASSPDPEYWVGHIARNRARDREVTKELRRLGYVVLRFWDDAVNKKDGRCVAEIRAALGVTEASESQSPG